MQIDFSNNHIQTIFLDIRGTVLSPWDDSPMSNDLCQALGKCLEYQINLVFASATSLASTGMGFVIEPLLQEFKKRHINNDIISSCLAYIESGTVAYRFDAQQKIKQLENFEVLSFSNQEKELLEHLVPEVCASCLKPEVRLKFKPGQVNCYVDGPWSERRRIADYMNDKFLQHALYRLTAQVPSARETIDVSISTKSRIAQDYLNRTLVKPNEILIIGDSLQVGGNDEPLSKELPGSISVQVGEIKPNPEIIHSSTYGPKGVLQTVNCLLRSIKS